MPPGERGNALTEARRRKRRRYSKLKTTLKRRVREMLAESGLAGVPLAKTILIPTVATLLYLREVLLEALEGISPMKKGGEPRAVLLQLLDVCKQLLSQAERLIERLSDVTSPVKTQEIHITWGKTIEGVGLEDPDPDAPQETHHKAAGAPDPKREPLVPTIEVQEAPPGRVGGQGRPPAPPGPTCASHVNRYREDARGESPQERAERRRSGRRGFTTGSVDWRRWVN